MMNYLKTIALQQTTVLVENSFEVKFPLFLWWNFVYVKGDVFFDSF